MLLNTGTLTFRIRRDEVPRPIAQQYHGQPISHSIRSAARHQSAVHGLHDRARRPVSKGLAKHPLDSVAALPLIASKASRRRGPSTSPDRRMPLEMAVQQLLAGAAPTALQQRLIQQLELPAQLRGERYRTAAHALFALRAFRF
jgi:hypothetical protein